MNYFYWLLLILLFILISILVYIMKIHNSQSVSRVTGGGSAGAKMREILRKEIPLNHMNALTGQVQSDKITEQNLISEVANLEYPYRKYYSSEDDVLRVGLGSDLRQLVACFHQ